MKMDIKELHENKFFDIASKNVNVEELNTKKRFFGNVEAQIFDGVSTKYSVVIDTWGNGTPFVKITDGWVCDNLIQYSNGKIAHDWYWREIPKYLDKLIEKAYETLNNEISKEIKKIEKGIKNHD